VRVGPWTGPLAQVRGGLYHGLAIGKDGRLWGWGDNCEGELGAPGCTWFTSIEPVNGSPVAVDAIGGWCHTLGASPDGHLWSLGCNDSGQRGTGDTAWSSVPAQVAGFALVDNAFLAGDQDQDGLPTWREYQLGTDPLSADTDGDGLPDAVDAGASGSDLDPDGDGLSNVVEAQLGTDPYAVDTDGDGVADGADAFPLDPTRSQAPVPDPTDHTPPVITLTYPTNARPVGGGGF